MKISMSPKIILLLVFGVLLQSYPIAAQPIEYDIKLGAAAAETFIAQHGVYNDPELKELVDKIGYSLVDQLSEQIFEFRFIILDDPAPNAFALPGGFVFVTRGILALIESPDELAGVIGHEIVHVQKRHAIQQMKHSVLPTVLQLPFKIAGSVVGGRLGEIIESPAAAGSMMKSSYSRKNETEADTYGIVLAARAGYDPNALAAILDRLSDWSSTLNEKLEARSYFSDHPYTPDRVDAITEESPELSWTPNKLRDSAIDPYLDNLMIWVNPAKGVFVENYFLHPVLNLSVKYPKDWSYSNENAKVSAINKEQTSSISLGIASASKEPKTLAKDFMKELKEHSARLTIEKKELSINDSSAYLVKVSETINGARMTVQLLWLRHGEYVYKITTIDHSETASLIIDFANSLRPLSPFEKTQIKTYRLRFVKTEENETFESFSKRNENVLNEEMWRILNGWNDTRQFKNEESVRIVIKAAYYQ